MFHAYSPVLRSWSILKYCQRMWPISAANFRCVTIHPMPYGRWSSSVCKWRFTSFRPHTFRCPALSICASRPQKPPYSKRKWSIPVGNFRSAVVHAILTGLAFLLYWQRMWRIRWLPLDGSVPCFTAMASSVCREGCSRFRYFKCIISLFLRVRASLYDCSIYRNGETM